MLYRCSTLVVVLVLLAVAVDAKKAKKAIGAWGHEAHPHIKCSCCHAIAEELGEKMNETARLKTSIVNSHRLSATNKLRRIDYESSELRAVELLEGLCKGFASRGYELRVGEDGFRRISKNTTLKSGDFFSRGDRQGLSDLSRKMSTFCDSLVDEHEDALTKAIRTLRSLDDLSHAICQKHLNLCSAPVMENSRNAELKLKAAYDARREKERLEQEEVDRKKREEEERKRVADEALRAPPVQATEPPIAAEDSVPPVADPVGSPAAAPHGEL